jgi:hypothetical protein
VNSSVGYSLRNNILFYFHFFGIKIRKSYLEMIGNTTPQGKELPLVPEYPED